MGKKLLICEKRETAEHLIFESKYFGDKNSYKRGNGCYENSEYIFTWCAGHLYKQKPVKEINPNYTLKFKLDNSFNYKMPLLASESQIIPDIEPTTDKSNTMWKVKKSQLFAIQDIFKKSELDEIILCADADPEGERIHSDVFIYNRKYLKNKDSIIVTRFWNTGSYKIYDAVKHAWENRKSYQEPKYVSLLSSQKAREMSDFLVGMKGTKLMTDFSSTGYLFRCGRLVSVILGMVGRRENEIAHFIPKQYWNIKGKIGEDFQLNHFYEDVDIDDNGDEIKVNSTQYFDESIVKEILSKTKVVNYQGKVIKSTKRNTNQSKPLPFSTDEFNQLFMKLYGVDMADSNGHLEWLRDEGYTSYPRTDGNYYSTKDFQEINQAVEISKKYYEKTISDIAKQDKLFELSNIKIEKNNPIINDKKAAAQNHTPLTVQKILTQKDLDLFASNPTHSSRKIRLTHLKEAYELIAMRCLIHALPDNILQKENLVVDIAGYLFEANAEKVVYNGWKQIDPHATKNANSELNGNYNEGDSIQFDDVFATENQTKPPKPYTQSSLLNALMNVHVPLTEEFQSIQDPVKRKEAMKRFKQIKKILVSAKGIGTGATRETALNKPLTDKLIEYKKSGKEQIIVLTNLGKYQFDMLPPYLKSLETSAIWEQKLNDIRNGTFTYDEFIEMVEKSLDLIVDSVLQSNINSQELISKYNIPQSTSSSSGNKKPNEKQIKAVEFIFKTLNIQRDENILKTSAAASEFIGKYLQTAMDKFNEMKNNGELKRTLSEKQIAFIKHPSNNAPQSILDLLNKSELNNDDYLKVNEFIKKAFENKQNQPRGFSDGQLKVLKDSRNESKLSAKTKSLLSSGKTTFTPDEFEIINKDLQSIFKSFKK